MVASNKQNYHGTYFHTHFFTQFAFFRCNKFLLHHHFSSDFINVYKSCSFWFFASRMKCFSLSIRLNRRPRLELLMWIFPRTDLLLSWRRWRKKWNEQKACFTGKRINDIIYVIPAKRTVEIVTRLVKTIGQQLELVDFIDSCVYKNNSFRKYNLQI